MQKLVNRTGQILVDVVVLVAAYVLAFLLRFDGELPLQMFKRLAFTWPYVVAFQFALLSLFGVRRFAWRYIGLRETSRILVAASAAAAGLVVARVVAAATVQQFGYAQYALIPFGVIAVNLILAFVGITGVRALRRMLAERSQAVSRRAAQSGDVVKTLLVGAGQAGVMVAKEIRQRPDLGIVPVGFVDDDPLKQGSEVHGFRVLGTTKDLVEVCKRFDAEQVLITMATAPGERIRDISETCERAGIPVKIIPGVYEIVGGNVNLSRIRPVAIEDLLGREAISLDVDAIAAMMRGRTVLVTGAGGSIGSELCRQLCAFRPARVVLLERTENALFFIHRELVEAFPDVELTPVIGDIADAKRMDWLFEECRPCAVFHAAAHKHVPMMEWNAGEAVKNNVFGTKTIADAADRHGAEIFVQVSTDKAVNPTSVMGSTKRVAEMYLQTKARSSATRFVTVRFGNVLGSNGSVVQIFREQIAKGGPVTVTHAEMQRYFMLISEACQLVLEAASFAEGGEIFLLDMGKPVRVMDLAEDMIRLSGYEPGVDIQIEVTGMRPGEKLFEELLNNGEDHDRTVHPKIMVGKIQPVSDSRIEAALELLARVQDGTSDDVRRALSTVVPEATLGSKGAPRKPAAEGATATAREAAAAVS
ncbi:MAG: nucleoside-diphosphate sugar epimerase/dehydratase [Polyangiaceae bacterium]